MPDTKTSMAARETGFLEMNGARIYFEVEGSGEPVVLIHAGVANLRQWDVQIPALVDAYRVIRYDTRGFGRTDTDDVEFSNRADIGALLDHLGEESAHIVGMSRAGSIALDFALEFPERVRSLTVAAGGIGGWEAPGSDEDAAMWDEVEDWYQAKDWERLADFEADFWADGPGQPRGRAGTVRDQVHEWVLTNYRAEKAEGRPQVLVPPAIERIGDLRAPLLVMLGTLDEPGTSAAMRHLAELVPGAHIEEFEGSAHMLNLEQPDRFNRLLREHLDANRRAPARAGTGAASGATA